MSDDDEILAQAQRRLEARREQWQRQQAAATPARFAPPRELGAARAMPQIPQRPGLQRTADTEKALAMQMPGLLYVVPPPAAEPSDLEIEQRVRDTIPEAFQGVTWDNLASLRNPEGEPSMGRLQTASGAQLQGHAAVREARKLMANARKIVLYGPTRAGKTLLAIAALEAELRHGNERARWVHAPTLRDPEVMTKALSSSFLVLDDLGYELDGAPDGSGWLSQKRGPACEFLGRWYLRRDARLIVTTFMGHGEMSAAYGQGAAARVYEGATVITLHRDSSPGTVAGFR